MKRLLKSILRLCLRPYFYLRTVPAVWRYVLNREGYRLFITHPLHLTPIQKRVVNNLQRDGVAVAHITELFPEDKTLLSRLQAYAAEPLPQAVIREGKPFLKRLWTDNVELTIDNPLLALALDERMVTIANVYLEVWGKVFYSSLDLTVPVRPGSAAQRSQRWHRDPEDRKICKIFVYLNNVDGTAGPFVYARGSHVDGSWGSLYPQRPPKGSYPPEGAVEARIPEDQIAAMTGKAGTIIFCDTAGLHRGGYATENERLMFTTEFSSKASLRPVRYTYPTDRQTLYQSLGSQGRYAIDEDFGLLKLFNIPVGLSLKYGVYSS